MAKQIPISDFRVRHNLSRAKFARLRAKAEKMNPGIVVASYHHKGLYNYNVLTRPDLIEALLPPFLRTADEINFNDLYALISELEAVVLSQREEIAEWQGKTLVGKA